MKKLYLLAMFAAYVAMPAYGVFASETPIRLCTGSESGVYFDAGSTIKRWAKNKLAIDVIETEGTIDNIERTRDGQCDAFIGQPDGLVQVAKQSPAIKKQIRQVGLLHREYLHVLCSKSSGYDDLSDLEGTTATLDIGAPGSGAWTTWQNIVAEDDGYSTIKTVSDGGVLALSSISSGDTDCMLSPSGLHSGLMNMADGDYADTVTLAGANDKDFNDAVGIDGKPLYTVKEIDSEYTNLQSSWGSDVDTISWQAGVYVNTDNLDKKQLETFIRITAQAASEIRGKYGK